MLIYFHFRLLFNTSDAANKDTPHYKLTVLIEQELPDCNRRETVDELAEKFCANHGASKTSRKRLSKTLFLVPRTRLDLLPYYSRLAAILDRIFSDVAAPMVQELENQFHGLARFKKNVNLENRLKNARYLGELTKFRVAPPIVVLRCLQRCLGDFTGYNIDVACCLLESCGRYLYRTPHTKARITSLMETMMRIRKARVRFIFLPLE
jgi:regulator of nonsense transcripts 2